MKHSSKMVNASKTKELERHFLNDVECNSTFQVPASLVRSYGPVMPYKAILRVDDSGKKWIVSIEKFKDNYFFTDGWKEFAEQVDLKSLDFLMFKSGSSSTQIGSNKMKRCRDVKTTSSILNEDKGSGSGDVNGTTSSILNENKDKCSRFGTTSFFSKELTKHNRYRVDIPRAFVLSSRIPKGGEIRLRDGEGREWPVRVSQTVRDGLLAMCGGWKDFVIGNKVMVGSTISFTWRSGNLVQTQIVNVGTNRQPLFSTAKNSGYNRAKHLEDPDF